MAVRQYRRGVRSRGRGRGASARGCAGASRGGRPPARDRRLAGRFPKPLPFLFLPARRFGYRRKTRALVGQRGGLRGRRGRHRGLVVAEVKEGVYGHHHDQHGEHGHRRVEDVEEPARAATVLPRETLRSARVDGCATGSAGPLRRPSGGRASRPLPIATARKYSSTGRKSQTPEPRPGELPRTLAIHALR